MYCSVSYILASASVESQGAAFVHNGEGEKLYRGGYFGSVAGGQIEAKHTGLSPRRAHNTQAKAGECNGVDCRPAGYLKRRNRDTRPQPILRAVLSLPVNQHCLLPSAWRLIGPMNAAGPAAGSLLSLQHLVTGSLNPTSPGRRLLRVINPANELISTEWRQAFPQSEHFRIRSHSRFKIFASFMDSALGKSVHQTLPSMPSKIQIHELQIERQLLSLTTL